MRTFQRASVRCCTTCVCRTASRTWYPQPGQHDLRRHRRRDQRVDRSQIGIGRVMVSANSIARTDQLFAAMFIVTVVALFLVGLVGLVGRRLTRWQRVGD